MKRRCLAAAVAAALLIPASQLSFVALLEVAEAE
jgi:hypothetical protein